jgi:hypothetical protein
LAGADISGTLEDFSPRSLVSLAYLVEITTRDKSRNSRLKGEERFCLRKSWKADGKNFGPLARLIFPSVFSLQSIHR